MKRETDQDSLRLERKIDLLTDIVQELRIEVQSLKEELRSIKEGKTETKKEDFNINDTPIVKDDICRVLNKYKGLQGLEFKVTKVTGDKIHFWHNGYPTWRIRTNVEKIAHAIKK